MATHRYNPAARKLVDSARIYTSPSTDGKKVVLEMSSTIDLDVKEADTSATLRMKFGEVSPEKAKALVPAIDPSDKSTWTQSARLPKDMAKQILDAAEEV